MPIDLTGGSRAASSQIGGQSVGKDLYGLGKTRPSACPAEFLHIRHTGPLRAYPPCCVGLDPLPSLTKRHLSTETRALYISLSFKLNKKIKEQSGGAPSACTRPISRVRNPPDGPDRPCPASASSPAPARAAATIRRCGCGAGRRRDCRPPQSSVSLGGTCLR